MNKEAEKEPKPKTSSRDAIFAETIKKELNTFKLNTEYYLTPSALKSRLN
jgi:hypothetical protein